MTNKKELNMGNDIPETIACGHEGDCDINDIFGNI